MRFWKNFTDSTSAEGPETSWYYSVAGEGDTSFGDGATGFIKFDSDGKIIKDDANFGVKETIQVIPSAITGTDSFEFELNFEKLSMYADDSSVKPTQVDGYPPGTLTSFNIGSDGILTGVYSNGRQQPLALVGIAVSDNAAGLQKAGSNLFLPTSNRGFHKVCCRAPKVLVARIRAHWKCQMWIWRSSLPK